jgi:two-component system, OmpR family, sensor kinase
VNVGLRRQLVLVFFLFALALLAVTLVPFAVVSTHAHLAAYMDEQLLQAQSASAVARAADEGAGSLAERYPRSSSTAATLLDAGGSPLAGPTDPKVFPAALTRAPELEQARAGRASEWVGDTPAGRRVFIAFPIVRDGGVSAVLWLSSSLRPVERLNYRTWATAGGVGAAGLLAAIVVGIALSRRLTRRLHLVATGAERFGAGRLDEPIPVEGHDEIASLADRLNQMADQIDHLMRLEKDFVAAASHQIRTPLAVIKIRIDEIRSLASRDPQVVEDLDEMAHEVDRLTRLVSGLLNLSASERAAAAQPRPIWAGPAIREALGRIEPLANLRNVPLDLEDESEGLRILDPPGAFEEVLFNLLDNAVKFSTTRAPVMVRARDEDGSLVVEVEDCGPGIPQAKRGRVFEPFYRATRNGEGHGLGLAISARLCEAAGATLSLEAGLQGGTLARVRWPQAPPGRGRRPPKGHARSSAATS